MSLATALASPRVPISVEVGWSASTALPVGPFLGGWWLEAHVVLLLLLLLLLSGTSFPEAGGWRELEDMLGRREDFFYSVRGESRNEFPKDGKKVFEEVSDSGRTGSIEERRSCRLATVVVMVMLVVGIGVALFVLESPRPGAINTALVERELCGVLVRTVAVARSTYSWVRMVVQGTERVRRRASEVSHLPCSSVRLGQIEGYRWNQRSPKARWSVSFGSSESISQ